MFRGRRESVLCLVAIMLSPEGLIARIRSVSPRVLRYRLYTVLSHLTALTAEVELLNLMLRTGSERDASDSKAIRLTLTTRTKC